METFLYIVFGTMILLMLTSWYFNRPTEAEKQEQETNKQIDRMEFAIESILEKIGKYSVINGNSKYLYEDGFITMEIFNHTVNDVPISDMGVLAHVNGIPFIVMKQTKTQTKKNWHCTEFHSGDWVEYVNCLLQDIYNKERTDRKEKFKPLSDILSVKKEA